MSREVRQKGLLRKIEATEEPVRPLSRCLDKRKNNQSPDAWPGFCPIGTSDGRNVRTSLLMLWRLEFAIGGPAPSMVIGCAKFFEIATVGTWICGLHLITFPSLINDGGSPFFRSLEWPISSKNKPEKWTLLVYLPTESL